MNGAGVVTPAMASKRQKGAGEAPRAGPYRRTVMAWLSCSSPTTPLTVYNLSFVSLDELIATIDRVRLAINLH